MKSFITITFLFAFLVAFPQSNKINIGHIDTLQSEILEEKRNIWIHVPKESSKEKFPVVYLLDGDGHFHSVVGMIQNLSQSVMPKMIVVGINNTNRMRDLTPTKGIIDPPFVDSTSYVQSGGGEKFISFIKKELIPHVESNYPTAPYRMFIGHSLGGLMTLHALYHHTDLFNAYVSIDPSLWWKDQDLLKEFKSNPDKDFKNTSVYLGIAHTVEDGMEIEEIKKDTTKDSFHMRSILEMHDLMQGSKNSTIKYKGKYYPNDTHGSVPLITEYDAFRFFFDFFKFDLSDDDFTDPNSKTLEKIVEHNKKLSLKMGYEIFPDEGLINSLGYFFMENKQMEKAENFFKFNAETFTESFNVFDSYGDFFAKKGDIKSAIENYKKSISLNPESTSKNKLEKLVADE